MNPPENNENQQDQHENVHRQPRNNKEQAGEVSDGESQQSSRNNEGTPLRQNNNNNTQRRTRWTKDMNVFIVRSYYTAIKTTPATYRQAMHNLWKERYGDIFSEQRICDQRRIIFSKAINAQNQRLRGKWLTQIELDSIRDKINQEQRINDVENPAGDEVTEQDEQQEQEHVEHLPPIEDYDAANQDENGERQDQRTQEDNDTIMKLEGYLIDARLTPFERRKKFRKPGKKDLKKLEKSCSTVNDLFDVTRYQCNDITEINDLTYAFALTSIEHANLQEKCFIKDRVVRKKNERWIKNLEAKIQDLRKEISRVEQMKIRNPSAKIKRNNQHLRQKYNITNERDRTTTSEKLKQKLLAKNNRLKRYKARKRQFEENRDFRNTPDKFYKKLRGTNIKIEKAPEKEQIENFWKPILGTPSHYNTEAPWIADYESTIQIESYDFDQISTEEVSTAIKNFANWKSPGIDNLQNFWWRSFEKIHAKLCTEFNKMMDDQTSIPEWFTTGRTTLLPKKQ